MNQPINNVPQLVDYDKTLFSLGTVLIELWLARNCEDLRVRNNSAWLAAWSLVNSMHDAGYDYVRAVERCLGHRRAAWDQKPVPRTLENDDFKKEVWSTVVAVLESNLEVSGRSCARAHYYFCTTGSGFILTERTEVQKVLFD